MPELHPRMDELLEERRNLELNEIPYTLGFFKKVLNASESVADYYRLLPESLHVVLDRLNIPESLPPELSDEQVNEFTTKHQDWIRMIKVRMFLDLITTS